MLKKIRINSDALMNCTHMKCGAQEILDEFIHLSREKLIEKPICIVKNSFKTLIVIKPELKREDLSSNEHKSS